MAHPFFALHVLPPRVQTARKHRPPWRPRAAAVALIAALSASTAADGPRFLFGSAEPVPGVTLADVDDGLHSLSKDQLEIFYGINHDPDEPEDVDIYMARRASVDEPFGTPQVVQELDSDLFDGQVSLSSDGRSIYFMREPEAGKPTEIYTATRPTSAEPFGEPTQLFGSPDGRDALFAPKVAADGKSLYVQYGHFRSEDNFNSDIYVSRLNEESGEWGELKQVPKLSGSEYYGRPSISPDNRALFYKAFHGGNLRGHGDLFVLTRADDSEPWSRPYNLGDTINSDHDDTFAELSYSGDRLYFNRFEREAGGGEIQLTWDTMQAAVLPFGAVSVSGRGGSYSQNFDSMGSETEPGVEFPEGWTFTANDVIFNQVTTGEYGDDVQSYAQAYNAGERAESDRSLAVSSNSSNELGELDLRTTIVDEDAGAVQIQFDIEAWWVERRNRDAKFQVILEADSGAGFEEIADLGTFATGRLEFPEVGDFFTDGNDDVFRSSHDTGLVAVNVPVGATMRTRWIGSSVARGVVFGLDDVSLQFYGAGDTNLDGRVDFADFLTMSSNFGGEGGWSEGNLNGDDQIDFADFLILSSKFAGSNTGASPVPEPSSIAILGILGLFVGKLRRKR